MSPTASAARAPTPAPAARRSLLASARARRFSPTSSSSSRRLASDGDAFVGSEDPTSAAEAASTASAAPTPAPTASTAPTPAPTASAASSSPSLFERVGGEDALRAAVDLFYEKNLADDRVSRFFDGADMDRLRRHQFNFMRVAFGGDASAYGGRGIFEAHKHLMLERGLDERHFDVVAENLAATLEELGVAADVVGDVVQTVAPLRELFDHEANEAFKAAEAEHERAEVNERTPERVANDESSE